MEALLYPRRTCSRIVYELNGFWKIYFDHDGNGQEKGYETGIPGEERIPVPSSFSDLYTDKDLRDFCGDIWYETDFFVPASMKGSTVELRFGAVTHRAVVYVNGKKMGLHEGGFLPFCINISDCVNYQSANRLVVLVNNELSETSLPNGTTKRLKNGKKRAVPYFDFFNYSGIIRPVWLTGSPVSRLCDYSVRHELNGTDSLTRYRTKIENPTPSLRLNVSLVDREGVTVASAEGFQGTLEVRNTRLWEVRNAYLYRIIFRLYDKDSLLDEYYEDIGIRTISIHGTDILLNNRPVYLKGFGKHEDSPVLGRTYSPCMLKRDFELMKWIGANSFRTSHYPYAEETYQLADREGFLVIDEVPAVGFIKRTGTRMFTDAGSGKRPESFFDAPSTPVLMENHLTALGEMIQRDKNHACVIAWSLFNEPESVTEQAGEYFAKIFEAAKSLDIQKRPCTFAMELSSQPEDIICHQYCDFWCMNRYYGWYVKGGSDISDAREAFEEEMNRWAALPTVKPMVFTEYGTDTLSSEHKLPSVMWSQEYQIEYLKMYHEIFDFYDFVKGEQVWNFADFQTGEGIARVNGNKKGIFTRDRQPKSCAFLIRERWNAQNNRISEKEGK